VYPMLPVSLNCPLLIAPSVFSKQLVINSELPFNNSIIGFKATHMYSNFVLQSVFVYLNEHRKWTLESTMYLSRSSKLIWSQFHTIFQTYSNESQL
jgi:predicted CDP-diglyceride synthetase/phosphatidate cytidylyltransferase